MRDLDQLARLARLDDLTQRTMQWADRTTQWQPLRRAKSVVRQVLPRVEALRVRLEAPLVVATFGGTGTGKSSLVNALVGRPVARAGQQRPTTTRPTLIVGPEVDLSELTLPLDEVDRVEASSPLLEHVVLLDCPDPDTSEEAAADDLASSEAVTQDRSGGPNLAILRRMLPHCDVLLYTSTQQKYKSARVIEELSQAAAGCRLVFVQTHADRSEDIREDWAEQLRGAGIDAPDLFFVDTQTALAGRPDAETQRLHDLLAEELTGSQRARIRRANVADLLQALLSQAHDETDPHRPQLEQLDTQLDEIDATLRTEMAGTLKRELLGSRGLWERRMVAAVTERWGSSPFAGLLRVWSGLGGWIASLALFRARGAAQMALIGAVQGVRHLQQRREEDDAAALQRRGGALGLDESRLGRDRLVVEGAVREAGFDPVVLSNEDLPDRGSAMEATFLSAASRRIDAVVARLAERNARLPVRLWYELLFVAYIAFVLWRAGSNFFYESFWNDEPILGTEFWIPALLFFLLWSVVLATLYTRRLHRGLRKRVDEMTDELLSAQLGATLFPAVREALTATRRDLDELGELRRDVGSIERSSTRLGAARPT